MSLDIDTRATLTNAVKGIADALYTMQMMDNSFYEDEARRALRELHLIVTTLDLDVNV